MNERDLPGWHNVRPDPQDAEMCDEDDMICEIHDHEYRWPESCPFCRKESHDKRAREIANSVITQLIQMAERS